MSRKSSSRETEASIGGEVARADPSTVTACRLGFERARCCTRRLFAWVADLLMVSFSASKSSSSRIYEDSERRVKTGEVGENWRLSRWG